MKAGVIVVLALGLAGCGEPFASPTAAGTPCPEISAAEHATALAAGAASGTASISASGTVSLTNGPGVVHCATFNSTLKPCRRPVDYVVRYTLADGRVMHVMVKAGQQYRFRIGATPTTCEIVKA